MKNRLRNLVVVVPVHNESSLLARCLDGLSAAVANVAVPVSVVVVLDSCTDDSPGIAERFDVTRVVVDALNVGTARAAGFEHARAPDGGNPGINDATWLATTDADSRVPPDWLRRQLSYADSGYDAVAGTVRVDDWSGYSSNVRDGYEQSYVEHARHIHGANIGFSSTLYSRVGGFRPLVHDEDVDLVHRFLSADASVAWADDLPVLTSGRVRGRAPAGFADHLQRLALQEANR
ncbi:glycosyltransferase [Saxibacter everestensis]|uniref:4,4'-diaponeurosporenoate glycosyltransferase n=1 Tax=Saxibacter everestensis TaxID=2909229 RepID=A0ABY8QVP5_9MICO|nr:glycosyltransferase [Brevibacteriaceae bacterium ZFBP1038]